MATHSSTIAWKIPWMEEPVRRQSMGLQRVRHDRATSLTSLLFSAVKCFSSVQFSSSVMSDSLWPRELQHARPPCPSPTSGVYSNSLSIESVMPSSHLILLSPSPSCPQSLPASGSFPMGQLFAWGGQSIGVSASASVLPMNTRAWSPLEWSLRTAYSHQGFLCRISKTQWGLMPFADDMWNEGLPSVGRSSGHRQIWDWQSDHTVLVWFGGLFFSLIVSVSSSIQ